MWDKHLNWLLGPKVWAYNSAAGFGLSWDDLLEYDYRVRKEAMKRVTREAMRLGPALQAARDCPVLMQRYFTLQLCTSGKQRGPANLFVGAENKNQEKNEGTGKVKRDLERELASAKRLR